MNVGVVLPCSGRRHFRRATEEGIKAGRNDRSRGERFDFENESAYKDATKGYNTRLGDKAIYQRYFRAGFENGYRAGWNGY